jgi:hypothetical protein
MIPFPKEWVHQLHLEHFQYSSQVTRRLCLITIASKALPSDPFQYEDTYIIVNDNINENITMENNT